MESKETDDVDDEKLPYMTVDADLYLKDIISFKKPRRIEFDDGKWCVDSYYTR